MTHKEIAERLRKLIDATSEGVILSFAIQRIADEIDPPTPTPGTTVWWRHNDLQKWEIGEAGDRGVWVTGSENIVLWENIKYKPARILAPDEVAAKVPPVTEWPAVDKVTLMWVWRGYHMPWDRCVVVTREEAERMQRDD